MKPSKLLTHFLAAGVITGLMIQSAKATNISYLASGETDSIRFQLDKKQGDLRIYQELNVKDFSANTSSLTGRVIGQYGIKGFNLSAMGTYANGYKQHVLGLGAGFKSYGMLVGIDDQEKPVGLVYGRYSRNDYSVGGHVDVTEDLARGRLDVMYDINMMRIGYEVQFNDRTSTNWIKAQITF